MPSWQRAQLLHSLTADTVDAILDVAGPDRDVPLLGIEIRCLDGAPAAPAGEYDNSVGGREVTFLLNVLAAPVPELFPTVVPQLVDRLFRAVRPWSLSQTQINFHGQYDEQHPASTAWPSAVAGRLAGIRRRHDPHRTFARPAGL